MEKFPEGKYLTTVKIGPKGQIVIPKEVREMFSLQTGDSLVLMADKGQGIALQPFSYMESLWNAVSKVKSEGEEDR
ncbi:MAG TPA: AbrB/MazE/SpoVT family DNA-binding domain-containing protein [Candidatus Borkfalkia excrementavium]|uniref:AbrB/MazE/SpoVT family DNA-binding domain-containing protein n=1 Tax=Candidatus Borkfalkia excrementavium TaxID=2838505 RepID=A0A9D1Z6X4_9FIRM|nr:AbrB/MazE/SpoVT family DNA-binding domain-containing protein [Candidatus Borkfalkia excrementavium]